MKSREKEIYTVTIAGAATNMALVAVKFVAGIVGKSTAMVADAIHSLSDLVSDVIVVAMVAISSKAQDKGHDYGHGKFETLATVAVSILLLIVGGKLFYTGMSKIRAVIGGGTIEAPQTIALWAALISIAFKEILFQWTARVGRKTNSPAVVTNAWHHRTDALSSIGSAIGIGAAILFGGKWAILDPIVGCLISIFIFVIAIKMCLPALNELTEASLPDDVESKMVELIKSVDGVKNVHELKTRKSGPSIIIDAHMVVDPEMSVLEAHAITEKVEDLLRENFGKEMQISLHVEPSIEAR